MKRITRLAAILLAALLLMGMTLTTCMAYYVPVTGIQTAGRTTISVGETVRWTASVQPSNATYQWLAWWAGNTAVATVDKYGNITAHRAGQCHIKIEAADGVKKVIMLNVVDGSSSYSGYSYYVPVTGINTAGKTTINVGDQVKWTASVAPSNATNKSLWWTAGNPGVATVDQSGWITAHKAGQCHITVTATNGVKKTVMLYVKGNTTRLSEDEAEALIKQKLGSLGTWVAGTENVLVCDGLYNCGGKEYYQFRLCGFVYDHYSTLTWYVISADGTDFFDGQCSNGYLNRW